MHNGMSSSLSKPTVAFFGATGGCTNAVLVLALKSEYACSALARTPHKLYDMLLAKGIAQPTIDAYLSVTKGDVKDLSAVKEALQPSGACVNIIVSGIGMVLGKNADSKICQTATRSILSAVDELAPPKRPFLVTISTTGISNGPRDVPMLFTPLYHVLLRTPHEDKVVMERLIVEAAAARKVSGYTLVRPALLTSGKERGMKQIRVGDEGRPAVGYTISRNDVGRWLFNELLEGDTKAWNGKKPSLTY